jgi:hypothetical protein
MSSSLNGTGVSFSNGVSQSIPALGPDQSWSDVTGSRSAGTTYTNSTGRPIAISVQVTDLAGNTQGIITVGGVQAYQTHIGNSVGYQPDLMAIVPNGATYVVSLTNYSVAKWCELR